MASLADPSSNTDIMSTQRSTTRITIEIVVIIITRLEQSTANIL